MFNLYVVNSGSNAESTNMTLHNKDIFIYHQSTIKNREISQLPDRMQIKKSLESICGLNTKEKLSKQPHTKSEAKEDSSP